MHIEDYGKHGKKEEISYFIFCFFKCPPFSQNTDAKAYAPPWVNVPSGTSGITKVDVKTQTFVDAVNSKQFPIPIRSSLSHHLDPIRVETTRFWFTLQLQRVHHSEYLPELSR
jgi:hypothetical protein